MTRFFVDLSSTEAVKLLIKHTAHMPCEVDVLSGAYLVDAKSIMGILSLDRAAPICVQVHGDEATASTLRDALTPLITHNDVEDSL